MLHTHIAVDVLALGPGAPPWAQATGHRWVSVWRLHALVRAVLGAVWGTQGQGLQVTAAGQRQRLPCCSRGSGSSFLSRLQQVKI